MQSKYKEYTSGDPELDEIVASFPKPDPDANVTLESTRAPLEAFIKMRRGGVPTVANLDVEDVTIPVKDGQIMVRKYIPQQLSDDGLNPLFVWYHGGGYLLGHPEMDDDFCRLTCVTHKISVVNVDYRLAPEHPFPTGVEDSYAALKWSAAHAAELKVDLNKGFLIGGESAGGNFTAVLTLLARDDPEFTGKLTGQILSIPNVCGSTAFPDKWKADLQSMNDIKNPPLLTPKMIEFFTECYGCKDETDIRRSPLLASSLANLPPAAIQVSGNDPVRDEGILYAKLLENCGVKTKLSIYPGAFHGFHKMAPKAKASSKYNQDTQDGIKWLLKMV